MDNVEPNQKYEISDVVELAVSYATRMYNLISNE